MPAPTDTLVSILAALSPFTGHLVPIAAIDDAIEAVPGIEWTIRMTRADHISAVVHGEVWSDFVNVHGTVNAAGIAVAGIGGNGWTLADCEQPDKVSVVFDVRDQAPARVTTPDPEAITAAIAPYARSSLGTADIKSLTDALQAIPGIASVRLEDREDGSTIALIDDAAGVQTWCMVRDIDDYMAAADDEWTAVDAKTGAVVAKWTTDESKPTAADRLSALEAKIAEIDDKVAKFLNDGVQGFDEITASQAPPQDDRSDLQTAILTTALAPD